MPETNNAAPVQSKGSQLAAERGVTVNGARIEVITPAAPAAVTTPAAAAAPAVESKKDDDVPGIAVSKPAAKPMRPSNVPEKFWNADKGEVNVDAVLASYSELEKNKSAAPAVELTAEQKAEADKVAAVAAAQVKPAARVMFKSATDELIQKGSLSGDTVKALEAAGYDAGDVEMQVEAMRVVGQNMIREAHAVSGGEANYKSMQAWAIEAIPEAERMTISQKISDPKQSLDAVKALWTRYQAEGPKEGVVITGGSKGTEGDIFKSQEEATKAMRDPKYKTDPAYRKVVGEKLLRSKRAGKLSISIK